MVVTDVDLAATTRWRNLGDFRSKLPRHVPIIPAGMAFRSGAATPRGRSEQGPERPRSGAGCG